MKDPYASIEESRAAIQPDFRSPAEKKLDEMLDERNAYEMGGDYVAILRQIAIELIAKQ